MNLSINFDFFIIFKIDTQIHTQKLNFYSLYLIILFEICKRFTNTQTQSSKLKYLVDRLHEIALGMLPMLDGQCTLAAHALLAKVAVACARLARMLVAFDGGQVAAGYGHACGGGGGVGVHCLGQL